MCLKYKDKIFIAFLIVVLGMLAYLRFANLGYSDYIPDETTVMDYFKNNGHTLDLNYLSKQRKGPMQWLLVLVTSIFYGNVFNELIFRIPFAIASVLSIIFFYKFLETHFEDKHIALLGGFLFGVNGFMVAFGRVVQYQDLNLLFSSISLYLFSRFVKEDNDQLAFFGTLFFSFSLLSHWDAVFILPYILWAFIKKGNFKLIAFSILITVVMFAPFFLPFALFNFLSGETHAEYFSSRVGLRSNFNLYEVRLKNSLYNPFLFTSLVSVFALGSLAWIKKNFIFWIWLIYAIAIFTFFIRAPGTHTYNLVIPAIILAASGYVKLAKLLIRDYQLIPFGLCILACGFLYYQSFLLYTDLSEEYPWEKEKIFRYETKDYDHATLTNNIIGFPHGRNWSEVRAYFDDLEASEKEGYSFITNDNNTVAGFYLDLENQPSEKMYLIGVKDPYSFVHDYQFSQQSNKHSIKSIEGRSGDVAVKIYKSD